MNKISVWYKRASFEFEIRLAALLSFELPLAVTKLPSDVLVVRTTTIQSSSEPIPIPVYLESLREPEYCDCVKLAKTRLGTRLGTHAGNMAPSLVTETFK